MLLNFYTFFFEAEDKLNSSTPPAHISIQVEDAESADYVTNNDVTAISRREAHDDASIHHNNRIVIRAEVNDVTRITGAAQDDDVTMSGGDLNGYTEIELSTLTRHNNHTAIGYSSHNSYDDENIVPMDVVNATRDVTVKVDTHTLVSGTNTEQSQLESTKSSVALSENTNTAVKSSIAPSEHTNTAVKLTVAPSEHTNTAVKSSVAPSEHTNTAVKSSVPPSEHTNTAVKSSVPPSEHTNTAVKSTSQSAVAATDSSTCAELSGTNTERKGSLDLTEGTDGPIVEWDQLGVIANTHALCMSTISKELQHHHHQQKHSTDNCLQMKLHNDVIHSGRALIGPITDGKLKLATDLKQDIAESTGSESYIDSNSEAWSNFYTDSDASAAATHDVQSRETSRDVEATTTTSPRRRLSSTDSSLDHRARHRYNKRRRKKQKEGKRKSAAAAAAEVLETGLGSALKTTLMFAPSRRPRTVVDIQKSDTVRKIVREAAASVPPPPPDFRPPSPPRQPANKPNTTDAPVDDMKTCTNDITEQHNKSTSATSGTSTHYNDASGTSTHYNDASSTSTHYNDVSGTSTHYNASLYSIVKQRTKSTDAWKKAFNAVTVTNFLKRKPSLLGVTDSGAPYCDVTGPAAGTTERARVGQLTRSGARRYINEHIIVQYQQNRADNYM